MSFPDVLKRGDDFLSEYPRTAPWWNVASHATCLTMILLSKFLINVLYKPKVHDIEKLDAALQKARLEKRSLLTVMNHMSVVDDPSFYALLPWRYHFDVDTIRWAFGAHNICFSTPTLSWFFNLGKVLGTKRFGEGPFQGSLDAAIRILSPDDTLDLEFSPWTREQQKPTLIQEINNLGVAPEKVTNLVKHVKPSPESTNILMSKSPFIRTKTSWFHVFPEGFVLQLREPDNNSMRYFKWGVSRLILESTRAPVVLPIFSFGFEKIAPEDSADQGIKRWLPQNLGAEIHIAFGDPIPDERIEHYRSQWRALCDKYTDKKNPTDLSGELRDGKKVQKLRSELAAELRDKVLDIREQLGYFKPENPKFHDPAFWKEYTKSEGLSDPSVQFIGQNWAIKRLQKHLPEYEEGE
ncbi:CIC11C00000002624 [Sungouiella intermedia]|uniref:Tafazzin family protein n=1 Tax=Sungouiella intermedia TaxID=45354 RepID=A0A1L0DA23_9ASCO|nr:CIC11C00000002624 [[Candida] intermedia]